MTKLLSSRRRTSILLMCVSLTLGLVGCDQLGIDTPEKVAQRKVVEAKAIGGACRHAMRAIEDCYLLNPKADKAAVFDGWREMDEYMRENKIEGVAPVIPRGGAVSAAVPAEAKVSEAIETVEDEPASPRRTKKE